MTTFSEHGNRDLVVSVIIPTLNEAAHLASTLVGLAGNDAIDLIVVDGNSRDATLKQARAGGARVITRPGGRAAQMNAGRTQARGDILLFLHADTILPPDWLTLVRQALARPGVVAGAFRLQVDAAGFRFRCLERLVALRSSLLQLPYGDQALFMSTATFDRLGGYGDLPIMEDFELVLRLRRQGRLTLLAQPVRTSARRWRCRGFWRTTLLNQVMIFGYLYGLSPARLARWYRGRGSLDA